MSKWIKNRPSHAGEAADAKAQSSAEEFSGVMLPGWRMLKAGARMIFACRLETSPTTAAIAMRNLRPQLRQPHKAASATTEHPHGFQGKEHEKCGAEPVRVACPFAETGTVICMGAFLGMSRNEGVAVLTLGRGAKRIVELPGVGELGLQIH